MSVSVALLLAAAPAAPAPVDADFRVLDRVSGRIYLPNGQFKPATAGQPRSLVPGGFATLVVGR